uniref:MSP domain-containing protein n=1 Tax=Acrobeloides nanus TaxID=290746 RepID=A0A914CAK5_9BILA
MAEILKDVMLMNKNGSSVKASDALKGKLVALCFLNETCESSKRFIPIFSDFYNKVDKSSLEIVFIPLNESEENFDKIFKELEGDWLYIQLGDGKIDELCTKYEVQPTIPTVLILNHDGSLISREAKNEIEGQMPPSAILDDWKTNYINKYKWPGEIQTQPDTIISVQPSRSETSKFTITITNTSNRHISWGVYPNADEFDVTVMMKFGMLEPNESATTEFTVKSFEWDTEEEYNEHLQDLDEENNDHVEVRWTNTPENADKKVCPCIFMYDDIVTRRKRIYIHYDKNESQ